MMLITAVTLMITATAAQLTVPTQELGFVYKGGHPCAKVKLASFLDLTCPDSAEAFDTLLQVADTFSGHDVQLRVYLFSLPYHRNSHILSKATRFLDGFLKSSSTHNNATVFDWMSVVFDNMPQLTTRATANLTEAQVVSIVTTLAQTLFPVTDEQVREGIYNSDVDSATRLEWKYGCTRGVYCAPMTTVNDIFVDGQSIPIASNLTERLEKLLASGSDLTTACVHSLGAVPHGITNVFIGLSWAVEGEMIRSLAHLLNHVSPNFVPHAKAEEVERFQIPFEADVTFRPMNTHLVLA